jgi:hypothetical protein
MTDANRLVAMLDVRIRDFERKMQQAERTTQRRARAISREFERTNQTASRQLAALARTFAGGLAGVLGGFSATAVVSGIRNAVSELSRLGKAARDVGLDVEELQGLQRGFARAARVSAEEATSAFERFAERVGQAAEGSGAFHAVVERYGIRLRNANGELRSQSELLREVSTAIRGAGSAQERLSIAQAAFGQAGRRMADAMRGGPEALNQMVSQARDAGDIIDRNLIHRAEILDDKFDALTRRVGTFFRTLAVGAISGGAETAIDTLTRMFGTLERAKAILGEGVFDALIGEMGELSQVQGVVAALEDVAISAQELSLQANGAESDLGALALRLRTLDDGTATRSILALVEELISLRQQFAEGEVSAGEMADKLRDIVARALEARGSLGDMNNVNFASLITRLQDVVLHLASVRAAAVAATAALPGGAPGPGAVSRMTGRMLGLPRDPMGVGHLAPTTPTRPRAAPPLLGEPVPVRGGGGGGGGGADLGEYQREIAAIRERTAAIEAEAAVLAAAVSSGREYGEAARYAGEYVRLMTAAQRDGLEITPQLTQEIEAAADAYARAAENADRAGEAMRNAQDHAKAGASAMADLFGAMVQGGDAARQALARLLVQIAQVQMQKAMLGMTKGGGGGFFGFLGSLLSLDKGGYTGDGGTLEPKGIVHGGEFVFSKKAVNRIGLDRLDALHRGVQGFASGGFVGPGGGVGGMGGGRIEVAFRAVVDGGGNLRPFVEQVSGRVAGREVQRATPGIVSQSAAFVREQAREFPLP